VTWRLTTQIFGGKTATWEDITDVISGLVIRASLHGGVESIQFQFADRWVDAYRWAYDHIGSPVYVFDNNVSTPVAQGVMTEDSISNDGSTITAYGPWLAYMFNQVYNDAASWFSSGTTDAQIKDILTDDAPGVNSNQDNIDATSTNNFPWQSTDNRYPGDLIPFLAGLSDSSNNSWYFWLRPAPMSGTGANAPIAWFKKDTDIPHSFRAWREDIVDIQLKPSLRDLANDVRVMWTNFMGVQQQTASVEDADSIARYWRRERWDFDLGRATSTLATQYRDLLEVKHDDIQQVASFRLNTWVYGDHGEKRPLWRAIADFPSVFTVVDLIPDNSVLAATLDNKRTFVTLAAEYDYDDNILSIASALLSSVSGVMLRMLSS